MNNLIPLASPLENITRIEYHGQPVLTTAQLAELLSSKSDVDGKVVTVNNLKLNFRNNADRFIEGNHYFKIEGEELDALRVKNFNLQISPMTRTLYLWTKRGAARHCKSVGSEFAWTVFEVLEDTYFNVEKIIREAPMKSVSDFNRGRELGKLAAHAEDPYTKRRLVARAANLILGEEFLQVPNQPIMQMTLFK